jgi:hypothetical protein
LYKGLDPADKATRVYNFHKHTIAATREMMEACGFSDVGNIGPSRFFRKKADGTISSFDEIYFPAAESLAMERKLSHLN